MKRDLQVLYEALMDITGLLNRPQQDGNLLALAGVELDRALFPLLVRIERRGPLAIGDLAGLVGRDYTTVSRQVTKLATLGLVKRQANAADARITDVRVTPKGQKLTAALDAARQKLLTRVLADWTAADVTRLANDTRRLADSAAKVARGGN